VSDDPSSRIPNKWIVCRNVRIIKVSKVDSKQGTLQDTKRQTSGWGDGERVWPTSKICPSERTAQKTKHYQLAREAVIAAI
jgi:hypothetical protein